MMNIIVTASLFLAWWSHLVNGECANACNGHGKCTSFDMCICNRNWQAADCSERVCQFGLAHVDTPKGDLDHDGKVTNANEIIADNHYVYPYGTTEQYPAMQDSDLQTMQDTAHFYMECSNKGRCDRETGECICFPGYDGVACQRASCPGYPDSCSGHGVCKTIKQLANSQYENVYQLWNQHSTMGCECDAGYFGPDCSQRTCKYGVDPIYLDDAATIRFSTWDVGIMAISGAQNFTSDLFSPEESGYWALRFFDSHGEDWLTRPIMAGATCDDVVNALESLPNNVIPTGSVLCTKTSFFQQNGSEITFSSLSEFYDAQHPKGSKHQYRLFYKMALWEAQTPAIFDELSPATATTPYFSSFQNRTGDGHNTYPNNIYLSGAIYRLKMYGNPGKLRQPEVEVYLDGNRPTLLVQGKKVITKVWSDGQVGENNDHIADHCNGVTVRVRREPGTSLTWTAGSWPDPDVGGQYVSFLTGFYDIEKHKLKACLGSADFDESNNVEVYNWDYGTKQYPHLIKLVRTVTTYTDGGYYAAVWFDTSFQYADDSNLPGVFRLLNPFYPPDFFETDNYDVYTTTGTLALTSEFAQATFGFASRYIYTTNVSHDLNSTYNRYDSESVVFDGDISCEKSASNGNKFHFIRHCLNTTDMFTLLNWEFPELNPPFINLYRAERVYTESPTHSVKDRWKNANLGPTIKDNTLSYLTHQITTDVSTNWGVSVGGTDIFGDQSNNKYLDDVNRAKFHVYKFFPSEESTYSYVAECSNRGLCNRVSGLCECFGGYTADNCDEQSSLAL
jgi:hypothetical protein